MRRYFLMKYKFKLSLIKYNTRFTETIFQIDLPRMALLIFDSKTFIYILTRKQTDPSDYRYFRLKNTIPNQENVPRLITLSFIRTSHEEGRGIEVQDGGPIKIRGSVVNLAVNPEKSHHVSNFPEIKQLDPWQHWKSAN